MKKVVTTKFGDHEITIETGRLAKQTDGAVLVSCGSNIVLVTAVSSHRPTRMDFFPLTVEYQEKFYSTGRIPGGYFKREGRPTELATLNARMIDRPIRPMFPEGYRFDTQIIAAVWSSDGTFPVEILANIGASAALHVSDVPFGGPTCAVRLGRIDGSFIVNPSPTQLETSDMNMIIAGSRKGLLMVEGESEFVSEAEVLEGLKFAHESMMPVFDAQDKLREEVGNVAKREFIPHEIDGGLKSKVTDSATPQVKEALTIKDKIARYAKLGEIKDATVAAFTADLEGDELDAVQKDVKAIFDGIKYVTARNMILDDKVRIDGRSTTDVRNISCEVAMLPRVHGSALFTRGETQVMGAVTLGTSDDEQRIDSLDGMLTKRFMLHYNFPPFSVGETGRVGGQSRREIGHGYLASNALQAILPTAEEFPYVIRIVGEVLESNGSSSMGTVCAGTMAMLDAGVPIKGNVAGIAMGLIKEGDKVAVLSDILGDEDHLGDMDFKVAGTRDGITAFQMDIKIDSVTFEIMETALNQAKDGRNYILDEMEKVINTKREDLSEYAPRIETIHVRPDKVREVIGSGGKTIREIIATTGVKIDIEDDGTINIASHDPVGRAKAKEMIDVIVKGAEVGKVYQGKVKKITDFGAFVEVLPNTDGLLHVSEISHERVRNVSDVLSEGDVLDVKVLDVDRAGRIKLSRKVLLDKTENTETH